MTSAFLKRPVAAHANDDAVIWKEGVYSYEWLGNRIAHWQEVLRGHGVSAGTIAVLDADFSPNAVALFFALVDKACIIVPLMSAAALNRDELANIADGEIHFQLDSRDELTLRKSQTQSDHDLYEDLRERGHPGLVLFSSGSTGTCKAAVHDLVPILEKFRVRRRAMRTMAFLLFDHIGGINTMLHTLSNGGCLVVTSNRSPDAVLQTIEKHRVQLLPTSPTFLNLILISEAYQRYRLDSLELVTYGTEPMPEPTLIRFHQLLPHVRLQQTYGLSEVGILQSKSRGSDSLWVKIGGQGFETRIVDGVLHIKARSAMLGYLNAASPFTSDGWLNTGDRVEVDGEYVRFLGRESDVINVGGEKVHPTEVEHVIQELDNVAEVSVYGEMNPITGAIVCARITVVYPESRVALATRLKKHCQQRLQAYKVPVRVSISPHSLHNDRFKKVRHLGE